MFHIGDRVKKTGGDYVFVGTVQAVFAKRSGAVRVVVENWDGILHIFNPTQLLPWVSYAENTNADTGELSQAENTGSSKQIS